MKNKLLFVRRKVVKFLSNFLIFKPLRREFIIIFSQKSGFFRRVRNSCQINNLMKLLRAGTKFPHPVGIVIAGDVSIGDNVIIAANSLVTKDVPSNSIVFGVNKLKKIEDV